MPMQVPTIPFKLSPEDMGTTSVIDNMIGTYMKGLQANKAAAELPYAGDLAKSTAQYKSAMADYLMSPGGQGRGLSPLGKLWNERNFYANQQPTITSSTGNPIPNPNYSPNANNVGNTGDERQDAYDMAILKNTTDTQARQRNLYASNIEKTLDQMKPEDATYGAGAGGFLKNIMDSALAPFGKESEGYDRNQKYQQAAEFLASQVRQFYGDSIQPAMRERLEKLANPATWRNNPKIAKELLEETKRILRIEMQTYRDAMRNKKIYMGNNDNESNQAPPETSSEESGLGNLSIQELLRLQKEAS